MAMGVEVKSIETKRAFLCEFPESNVETSPVNFNKVWGLKVKDFPSFHLIPRLVLPLPSYLQWKFKPP